MRLTVLGGTGGWPAAGTACSGYLVEHDGYLVLVDPGYATFPRLLEHCPAAAVDAVLVSHGHPDHCADLSPLLRARAWAERPGPPLPVYAPPGALDAVLALDRPGALDGAFELREFTPGAAFETGPFGVRTWLLPHWQPNAGLRLQAGGAVLAYTGDTGPSPELPVLARDADLLVAEASYPELVPGDMARYLSSARQAGQTAAAASARGLLLTHLMPGTDPGAAIGASSAGYGGDVAVAVPGLTRLLP
jgi:ribonuclease BN (tRNA processing enzyme)